MFNADWVSRTYLKEGHCERKYLDGVLRELERFFRGQPSAPDFEVYVHGPVEGVPPGADLSRTIVLSLSEEKRLIPPYFPRAYVIFKQHAPYLRLTRFGLIGFRPANVFPLPLGYDSHVPEIPPKPVRERTVDVFFSGSNWKSRQLFFRAARRLAAGSHWKVEVTATDSFHSGLSSDEYARKLADTKIALCPKGFVSTESFRMYEAMRAGCVVVTVRQPRSWYRDGWPVVELKRWSQLERTVNRLLDDPVELDRLQKASIRWWNEKCSEKAVAEFIGRTSLDLLRRRGVLALQSAGAILINTVVSLESRLISLIRRRKLRDGSG